ncbi:MAG: ABC transporter ATP-binding protein [Candidatus Altiarchaeota archaeon]|nr:ABC transporter ATP-binding protein [Candidatus Altiarchaeota archaeon]
MAENMLEVRDLLVDVGGKRILNKVNLDVASGESRVLFGPNGSGKTTLLMAILGIPGYEIAGGSIVFNGKDVTKWSIDERARHGIGFGFQQPPEVVGVKLGDMLKVCEGRKTSEHLSDEAAGLAERLDMASYLDRDVNVGFSVGERKRSEVLQLLLMKPRLMLLDEPDSGVDIDSLSLIGGVIQEYLKKKGASALIITHQGHILEHIKAGRACMLIKGSMYCYNKPGKVLEDIRKKGYEGCIKCHNQSLTSGKR